MITAIQKTMSLSKDTAVSMCHSGEAAAVRDGCIFALSVVSGNRRGELRNLPMSDLMTALDNRDKKVWEHERKHADYGK
jgi:hypothetical protein